MLKITLTAKEELTPAQAQVSIQGLSASEGKDDLFPTRMPQVTLSAVSQAGSSETVADSSSLPTIPAGEEQPAIKLEESLPEQQPEQETGSGAGQRIFRSPTSSGTASRGWAVRHSGIPSQCRSCGHPCRSGTGTADKEKRKQREKTTFRPDCLTRLQQRLTTGSVYAFGGKGDLNGDGKVGLCRRTSSAKTPYWIDGSAPMKNKTAQT